MRSVATSARDERIARVLGKLKEEAAGDHRLDAFAAAFYEDVDPSELGTFAPNVLASLTHEAFGFYCTRAPGTAKVRVRAVSFDRDQPPATVIEVANDDMPFLVDSILAELVERGLAIQLVVHPIMKAWRDEQGGLQAIGERFRQRESAPDGAVAIRESFILIQTSETADDTIRQELRRALERILEHVRAVVDDWRPMSQRLREVINSYKTGTLPVEQDDLEESIQFLEWIADENFVFLGMRNYRFLAEAQSPELRPEPGSGLGLLRDPGAHVLRRPGETTRLSPEILDLFLAPDPLIVTKANLRSDVHRRAHMDTICVKRYENGAAPTGELRIVGLFTASAYNRSTRSIPFLRRKCKVVLQRLGHSPESHSGRALQNVLETYPRDELFQIPVDLLCEFATEILHLELKPRTKALVRRDQFERFVSVLVYVSRDRFNTTVRERICDYLATAFGGYVSSATPFFTDAPLVRLHVVIWRERQALVAAESEDLDARIEEIVRTWPEALREELRRHYGARAGALFARYAHAFSAGFEDYHTPVRAIADIQRLELLSPENRITIRFYRDDSHGASQIGVTLYQLNDPIPLSRRVPIFENMGFAAISERTFRVSPVINGRLTAIYLHDITLETRNGMPIDITEDEVRLEDCFVRIWRGEAVNDTYNGLVLKAGLDWREAAVFRAYGSYLRQIGAPFGQTYLSQTLLAHADIVGDLIELFHTSFDPDRKATLEERQAAARSISAKIEEKLENVASLDEDRILRRYLHLMQATLRTNFYQRQAGDRESGTIAFKLDSRRIEGVPAPQPFAEIFVHSPRVEGVHLRHGPIARGGIRWSDRAQDFRVEIHNLAKAQQVKNAVIVPQGAKGGFYPLRLPQTGDREARMQEAIACYKIFISCLLSLTDNLRGKETVRPERVVCHDGTDAYLVVAADKGTATFSDIANAISQERGFWLDDAFASGGSSGYDHKKMGITARGAWEGVKRHFREMNIDIQTTPFTVIGVGDMSGDVFGNGMLLSRKIRLIAAFDHRDIFIDPDPDPETSWKERKRLFDLPRSSWQDYDTSLISQGGGVFSRSAKYIRLSPQIRALSGIEREHATPNELIRAILRAEVDLLWFGGIGTFVRSSTETNEQVGDRTNDQVRVSARDLRVKVIGEGANLGITQRGRIEFALGGGRINTDAIDNSAGVNSSDYEVNLKIALGKAEESGKITRTERNALLAGMTDEVAQNCLRNNYLQTLAISLGVRRGLSDLGFQARLMRVLEQGGLDREVEDLPSDAEIAERLALRQPLTRPELAVLLAFSKIALYHELIDSQVANDPYLSGALLAYFPATARRRFDKEIEAHPLRREIIATQLSNTIINRGGSTFVVRLTEETGHDADEIAHAFAAVMEVFELEELYNEIDSLDNRIDGSRQLDLYLGLQDVLRRHTAWFLRHGGFSQGLSIVIERHRSGIRELCDNLDVLLSPTQQEHLAAKRGELIAGGVPEPLARRLSALEPLGDAPDIVLAACDNGEAVPVIAKIYYEITDFFRINEMRAVAETLAKADFFDRLAINSMLETVSAASRLLVGQVMALAAASGQPPQFTAWREQNAPPVARTQEAIGNFLDGGEPTLAKLTVAVAHLRDLAPA